MDLRHASFAELCEVLSDAPCAPWPGGVWRGTWLMPWPERSRAVTLLNHLIFDVTPYGIDLDRAAWWFVHPRARIARFTASLGPSRFVASDIVRLEYAVSALPRPLRGILYDEVKPLGPELMLGIGAIDRAPGVGERFLFQLQPA